MFRAATRAAFFSLLLIRAVYSSEPQSVLTQDVGFVPEMGGAFVVKEGHFFYVGREKKIVILDGALKVFQNIHVLGDAAAIDFADVDNDGNEDLIEFTQNGVFRRLYTPKGFGEPHQIIRERLALPLYVDNLEQAHLATDFNGDGFIDFFLPAEGKFIAYRSSQGKKYDLHKVLPYQPRGSFTNRLWQNSDLPSNSIRSTVIIPQPIFVDFNKDGFVDAAARIDERIYYFLSENKTPFGLTRMHIYPMPQEDIYVSYAEFADFDGDGNIDLIYSAVKGLGLNIRVDMKIFKGTNHIPDPKNAIVHHIKGGVFSPLLAKMRNRQLLLLPTIDTGLSFFVNYIIRSKVSLTLQLIDPIREKDAVLEKTTLTFDSKESAVPGFAYADFNNDGSTDFALGTEINAITIYGGNDDFSKKEIARIAAPAYGIFKAVSNKRKEHSLFIFMTQKSKAEKKTTVYLAALKF